MVEKIECLGAKLQTNSLSQVELAAQRKIDLMEWKSSQLIAT